MHEQSVTLNIGGKWVNLPSVRNGKRMGRDEITKLYEAGELRALDGRTYDTVREAVRAAKLRSEGPFANPSPIAPHLMEQPPQQMNVAPPNPGDNPFINLMSQLGFPAKALVDFIEQNHKGREEMGVPLGTAAPMTTVQSNPASAWGALLSGLLKNTVNNWGRIQNKPWDTPGNPFSQIMR